MIADPFFYWTAIVFGTVALTVGVLALALAVYGAYNLDK